MSRARVGRSAGRTAIARDEQRTIEDSKLRLCGVGVICLKLAAVPLVFDHGADFPFTVPKALLSHALSYVLAGLVLALVIRFGRALLVWSPIHAAVSVFLGVTILASALAEDRYLALFGTHARMLGLGTILDGGVLYIAIAVLPRRPIEVVAIVGSIFGASILVLVYEAIQLLGRDPLSWSINGTITPFSTIGQPTTLAHYLIVLAAGALALAVFWREAPPGLRLALGLYSMVLVVAALATGTRSSVVGVVAGLATIVVIGWLRSGTPRQRLTIAVAGAGVATVVVLAVAISPVGARVGETLRALQSNAAEGEAPALDASTTSRLALYRIALDSFAERPLLGYGPDNFVVAVTRHRPGPAPLELRQSLATSAHSWVADVAVSSGLLGMISFGAVVAIAAFHALRPPQIGLAAVGLAVLGAYLGAGLTTVNDVATAPLFWLGVGAITATTGRHLDPDPSESAKGRRRQPRNVPAAPAPLAYVPIAIAVVLALWTWPALDASRLSESARNARLPGRVPQAIELALRATRADSLRAEYWHGLGLAYVAAMRWPDATVALERAASLAPYDTRYVNDQIAALLALGDPTSRAKAAALTDGAVATDPNNPQVQLMNANVKQATGRVAEALDPIERAIELDPGSSNDRLYVTAAQVYLALGRPADGLAIARKGLGVIDAREVSLRSIPLRLELARALAATGQKQEALAELDLILRMAPGHRTAEMLRLQIRADGA